MRAVPRRATGIGLTATLLTGGVALAAAPTGDPAGVAAGRAEVQAIARVHTLNFSQSGYAMLDSELGGTSFARWKWGAAALPRGWVRATEQGTIELRDNRVLWTRDVLSPVCPTGACAQYPVVILTDSAGTFFAYGSLAQHTCYAAATGPFIAVGAAFAVAAGDYSAPVVAGGDVKLTYTYAWDAHQQATDTDTIARSTGLLRSAVIDVAGNRGYPAFEVRSSVSYGPARPLPKINLCSTG